MNKDDFQHLVTSHVDISLMGAIIQTLCIILLNALLMAFNYKHVCRKNLMLQRINYITQYLPWV